MDEKKLPESGQSATAEIMNRRRRLLKQAAALPCGCARASQSPSLDDVDSRRDGRCDEEQAARRRPRTAATDVIGNVRSPSHQTTIVVVVVVTIATWATLRVARIFYTQRRRRHTTPRHDITPRSATCEHPLSKRHNDKSKRRVMKVDDEHKNRDVNCETKIVDNQETKKNKIHCESHTTRPADRATAARERAFSSVNDRHRAMFLSVGWSHDRRRRRFVTHNRRPRAATTVEPSPPPSSQSKGRRKGSKVLPSSLPHLLPCSRSSSRRETRRDKRRNAMSHRSASDLCLTAPRAGRNARRTAVWTRARSLSKAADSSKADNRRRQRS